MSMNRIKIRSPLVTVMAQAAMKAAKGLIRDFGEIEHLQVSRKGPGNFVTSADHRAEKILRADLEKARPEFSFLMEESGETIGSDPRHRWIVDPLDGTTNFMHGLPHFAISIALEFNEEIIAGLVFDPIKDEMFYAEKGRGAFMNERRLRVSGRTTLADALVGMARPYPGVSEKHNFDQLVSRIKPQVSSLRQMGAATLDMCYVAAGRYDGFWATSLTPWDIAAGLLIVREAGGYVSDLEGAPDPLKTGTILASNDPLFRQLLGVLKG